MIFGIRHLEYERGHGTIAGCRGGPSVSGCSSKVQNDPAVIEVEQELSNPI